MVLVGAGYDTLVYQVVIAEQKQGKYQMSDPTSNSRSTDIGMFVENNLCS